MGVNGENLLTEYATVTVRTPTGDRDAYGNVITSDTARTTFCWHHQTDRTEQNQLAEQTWDAYFPPDEPLQASDQVTIEGVSYEVVGPPWQTFNPRTRENGLVQATLRRTDG